ncbi:MAG: beta-propeller domain-containing protein [Acidimicrobiales bacterium]
MIAAAAAITMGVTACSSADPEPASSGPDAGFVGLRGAAPTMLQEGRSCDAVLEDFQSFAPAVLRDSFGFAGGDVSAATVGGEAMETMDDAASAPAAAEVSTEGGSDGATSETNTQEAGIDEPDVVETDGDFVYLVDEDRLVILDGSTAEVQSRTQLAGYGAQLLLSGDRLLAIAGGGGYGIGGSMAGGGIAVDDAGVSAPAVEEPAVEESATAEPATAEPATAEPAPDEPVPDTSVPVTIVPDTTVPEQPIPVDPFPMPSPVDPPSFPADTVIQLIDVSNRSAPVTVQTTELEGQHVSTRVVDGVARVVISTYPQMMPFADMPVLEDQDAVDAAVAEGVASSTIADWLPSYRTSTDAGSTTVEGPLVECEDVLVPEVNAGLAETSVLRVDFEDGFDPSDTTTVVAEAGTVYASASTLYIAATRYVSAGDRAEIAADDWSTALHAFDLRGDGPAVHVGAGEVPGNTLNQYSLSEHDGYLRIATTEGTPWGGGEDSESAVRVLRLDGSTLAEVGMVGGLGRTETIQSVRFMGSVGYVVTFRQTDPLYVIDLSDPTAPAAVGELKIPGFSSYLHPVGEGRLVGVGRDADLQGNDRGFLLSLFDVSDPTAPQQLQTYTEPDAHSAAGFDPKAFLWWAPESAAVVPMERYGLSTEQRPDGFEVGMAVFDIDDGGITERATITVDGRYPSRALVVQDRLWSLFDGGVYTSGFGGEAGTFNSFR